MDSVVLANQSAVRRLQGLAVILISISVLALPLCADVCNPADLAGVYGFQLSGDTAISGESKPVASLGRIVLSEDGLISGYSTVMFAGYLLGNPVTGTFESHWDCTITWILQDDSGSFQHFSGVAATGGRSVHFSQTDPGGAQRGTMARIPTECKASDLRNEYGFTLSGSTIAMVPGETPGTVTVKGLIQGHENGGFKLSLGDNSTVVTDVAITVDAECIVEIKLTLPAPGAGTAVPTMLRGVLIDGGKQILAIETDAGATVLATLTAR
jgi:hypothetical protein